jgi:hypothetical protein
VFEVLTAAGMKVAVFWIAAPRGLVEAYQYFRGTYHLQFLLITGQRIFHGPGFLNMNCVVLKDS